MSWANWLCLALVIIGFIFFLYGANYYNATIGWAGVYLFASGIAIYLIVYIYNELTKKAPVQKP
jgi:membrane-bound ClpP family serine protease